jgi:adenylate cyclase
MKSVAMIRVIKNLLKSPEEKREAPASCFSGVGTLLLSDMFDIARISEGMSPDELARLMNAQFRGQTDTIKKFGGLIIRSVGDATMVVWGPSHSSPSHADLALDCAREILRCRHQEAQAIEIARPSVRIALASGKMAVTEIHGRLQVYGLAVGLAERIFQLQERRTGLLFTSETAALFSRAVASTIVGHVQCPGEQEVPVFQLKNANE